MIQVQELEIAMLWTVQGASDRTGVDVSVILEAPDPDRAASEANAIGILVSQVSPRRVDRVMIDSSVNARLSKSQMKQLRRVSVRDIGFGVLYGLILWTGFCFLLSVTVFAVVVLLGISIA